MSLGSTFSSHITADDLSPLTGGQMVSFYVVMLFLHFQLRNTLVDLVFFKALGK